MTSLRLLLLLSVLCLPFSPVNAAPPPELTVLRQQYEKVFAERVTTVHEAAVGALDAKFTTALDNAATQAKGAGDLPTVLAIQGDKKILAEKQPLPADDDKTPEPLKKLRGIYRGQMEKLTEQRTANALALLTPYIAKLKELEATLTKGDRIEEAQEVLAYREGLKADAVQVAAPPVASTMPPAAEKPGDGKSAPAADAPAGKGDDHKAAEWVLSVGGYVKVSGNDQPIKLLAALPNGRFQITAISMPSEMALVDDAAFDRLANLDGLLRFKCSDSMQSDAALRFLSTCPNLSSVDIQNWDNATGAWLNHLTPLKKLTHLWTTKSLRVDITGLSAIRGDNIEFFESRESPVDDKMLEVIGKWPALRTLWLRKTKITDAGIPALAALTKLSKLDVTETPISVEGLRPLSKLGLTQLGFGLSPTDLSASAAELGRLFPKVESFIFPPGGKVSAAHLMSVATAWPKLTQCRFPSYLSFEDDAFASIGTQFPNLETLDLWHTNITDTQLAGVSQLKKLRSLAIHETKVTDACLPALAKMRTLKSLALKKSQVTDAGVATLRKQRPDMNVDW